MTARLRDGLLALAVGLLCAAIVSPRALFGARSLMPASPLRDDPVFRAAFPEEAGRRAASDDFGIRVHYPAERFAAEELRAGRLPLWNPLVGAGEPLLGQAHSAPLSPFLLPFWSSPSEQTYTWSLLLRVAVAAAATVLFARRGNLGRAPAALAGVTYGVSGAALARFHLFPEGAAYAMLPLVALAAARVVKEEPRGVPLLALAVGATIYSTHPEMALLAVGGGVLLALLLPGGLASWGSLLGGVVLGGCVGAAVVLPFLDGLRRAFAYQQDPTFAAMLAPDSNYFALAPDFLRVGAAPLLLAGLGVLTAGREQARAAAVGLGAVLVFFGAVMFAQSWALFPLATLIPPRYLFFLAVFAVAILAGHGLEELMTRRPPIWRLVTAVLLAGALWGVADALTGGQLHRLDDVRAAESFGGLVVVAAGVLAGRVPRRFIEWSVFGLATVTLTLPAARVIGPNTHVLPDTPSARAVASLPPPPSRLGGIGALQPDTASLLGKADVRAAGAIFPSRYRLYMSLVAPAELGATQVLLKGSQDPLLDLLGVKYMVGPRDALPRSWRFVWDDRDVAIAENPGALPRVFVPAEIYAAEDDQAAARKLKELARDGRLPGAAVVEASIAALPQVQEGRAKTRIMEYGPGRVVIGVAAEKPSLVVLTDTFDEGWSASVDGRPAEIFATDVLFRGVAVPSGEHELALRYRPTTVVAGLGVAGLALAVCFFWIVLSLRGREE